LGTASTLTSSPSSATRVAGGYLVARPGMGLATLTLVLAAHLFVDGIFEIIYAFRA
jgi:uncharacterized membrane protein HdeD (DUF308 family)